MARKVNYQAPFDHNGNLQHFPSWRWDPERRGCYTIDDNEWRDVEPFHATMTLEPGVTSGRSAKYLHWRDQDGRQYPMFVAELVELVVTGVVKEGGVAEGDWIVCKRGQNYGIRHVRNNEV